VGCFCQIFSTWNNRSGTARYRDDCGTPEGLRDLFQSIVFDGVQLLKVYRRKKISPRGKSECYPGAQCDSSVRITSKALKDHSKAR
jgi:hypothetical protein